MNNDNPRIQVSLEVWKALHSERKGPRDSVDNVLKRILKELDDFRMNVIKEAEQAIIDERLDRI